MNKQMTNEYLTRIVGSQFRLSSNLVLPVLEVGQPLILEPEPENPYDADAVKVLVNMGGTKYSHLADGPVIHLGYIPRSGTRTDTLGFGNKQVLNIIQGGPNWNAYLTFSPTGEPLVRIEVYRPYPSQPLAEDGKVEEDIERWKKSWTEGKYDA